jgi:hypothetical protein
LSENEHIFGKKWLFSLFVCNFENGYKNSF